VAFIVVLEQALAVDDEGPAALGKNIAIVF
jgi:hypothetical protein